MKAESVLKSIEREALTKGYPIIGPVRGAFLDDAVREYRPGRVLEVGTLVGYSAIRMARLLVSGGTVTCVELNPEFAKIALANARKADLEDKIEVLVGDAKRVLPELEGELDMAFLDANKAEFLIYLKSCERLLHPGSVVVADNVKSHASEVAGYLEYVRSSGRFRSSFREAEANYRYGARVREPDAVEVSVLL